MKSTLATFVLVQEGTQKIFDHLKAPGAPGIKEDGLEDTLEERGATWMQRPTFNGWGLSSSARGSLL